MNAPTATHLTSTPSCLIQDLSAGGWWSFGKARAIVEANTLADVPSALEKIDRRVNADGLWAAGFIAYEAGPAFDAAFQARPATALPLVRFGLYDAPTLTQLPTARVGAPDSPYEWSASVTREEYEHAIATIHKLIAAGDTYQVNYTLRLNAALGEDPYRLFLRMAQANAPRYGAYLDCGRFVIASASPELFFRLDGERLMSKPMKGTAARGLHLDADVAQGDALRASLKNRAENVMIVDMVRNDMSRIARLGSVRVPDLFQVERYPTLWQMTSTVECRTEATLPATFGALFPPASITGAPKARTTQIITELETTPRGVYTGSVGFIAPDRHAQFSVAIRTAVVDREAKRVEYAVGSGIVWDSESKSEYDECFLKARVVTEPPLEFSLLETLLWTPDQDYFLLTEHLERLQKSAAYFDFACDLDAVRERLRTAVIGAKQRQRVRVTVARNGTIATEVRALEEYDGKPVRLRLARTPVNRADPFLYNKTTHRAVYDAAKRNIGDCDDVLLWNAQGEVTESCIANVVVQLDGQRFTPPIDCGLLPGVFRDMLVRKGDVQERRLDKTLLARAEGIWLVNSVRGWRTATLLS